jgi:hypothetical protein
MKMGKRKVAALEVHQRGGDSTPNPTNQQQECISKGERRNCEAPFKGLENSMYVKSNSTYISPPLI